MPFLNFIIVYSHIHSQPNASHHITTMPSDCVNNDMFDTLVGRLNAGAMAFSLGGRDRPRVLEMVPLWNDMKHYADTKKVDLSSRVSRLTWSTFEGAASDMYNDGLRYVANVGRAERHSYVKRVDPKTGRTVDHNVMLGGKPLDSDDPDGDRDVRKAIRVQGRRGRRARLNKTTTVDDMDGIDTALDPESIRMRVEMYKQEFS